MIVVCCVYVHSDGHVHVAIIALLLMCHQESIIGPTLATLDFDSADSDVSTLTTVALVRALHVLS